MEEKAKKRFRLVCRIAKRLPAVIVAAESRIIAFSHFSYAAPKILYSMVIKIKTAAPFETTERNVVTTTGDPSYVSAVHKWNGTRDILNANPATRNEKASNCKRLKEEKLSATVPKSSEPEEP